VVIIRGAHLGKEVLRIAVLLAGEGHRLRARGQSAPVDDVVGADGPVHVLLVRGHGLQRRQGVEFTVREGLAVRAAAELADGLAARLGRSDGAFYAIGGVGRCRCRLGQVEGLIVLEGDANLERLAGFRCGDWASESADGVSVDS